MDAKEKGRFLFLARHSPWSDLLRINRLLSSFLCNLLFVSAFFASCIRFEPECAPGDSGAGAGTAQTSGDRRDSLAVPDAGRAVGLTRIRLSGGGDTDLFVYGTSLEMYENFKCVKDTVIEFRGTGPKTAVAIVDFPFDFRLEALQKYESLELLELQLTDDNPQRPVRSGSREFEAGQDCVLRTDAPLCRIELSRVENLTGKQVLLEDPAIFLTGANNSVELLRSSGFRQKQLSSDTLRVHLPHDIGITAFTREQALFCYPNDSREPGLGNPQTCLVLECRINGTRYEFPAPLPPFGRGAGIKVRYRIESESEYSYSIF